MKTHDWRPITGLIHTWAGPAQAEMADAVIERPGWDTRLKWTRGGYQAQIRVPRKGAREEATK